MPVRKAVIPAAGLGTRFLPATKAVPKELLPIVDRPTIQLIMEEISAAGIDTVALVTGRGKSAIEDHFDVYSALEETLEKQNKQDLAKLVKFPSELAQIVSVRQGVPRGLGHAVLCAKKVIGNEPFAVLLGDDLVDAEVPCIKQMVEVYAKYKKSVVALMPVAEDDISKFGIAGGQQLEDRIMEIDAMVEKPAPKDAPSNLAIVGRYVLTPRIFELLEETDPGKGGEIQLTDAMAKLMKEEGFIGYQFSGERHDAGDKFGFIKANIAYALKDESVKKKLLDYMREVSTSPIRK